MAESLLTGEAQPQSPTPQADPAPVTPAAPAAPNEPPSKAWFDGIADPAVKEWVQKVGLKSPEAAAVKAWNQEKYLGADKAGRGVILPKDENDKAAWDALYNRLGRPEKPEGYGIKLAEGEDTSLLDAALPVFHQLGLTTKQASALAEWWGKQSGTFAESQVKEQEQRIAAEVTELKREWGQEFGRRVEVARRGVQEAGLNEDQALKVEQALGPKTAAMLFEKLGRPAIEAAITRGDAEGKTFGMTPGEAKAEIEALMRDKEFGQKYFNGDVQARQRMERLHKIAAG